MSATGATAATSGFLLGLDYSEWLAPGVTQIATDGSGALYILSVIPNTSAPPFNSVTKLSADGKTILWQNNLGFAVNTMAVDPNGGVYAIPAWLPGDTSVFVAKLSAGGMGVAWKTPIGTILPGSYGPVLAADPQGRTYVAGVCATDNQAACVVRLNAAGSAIEYTAQVTGTITSIAVHGSGTAFVAGYVRTRSDGGISLLARLAPDGSAGFYSTTVPGSTAAAVAVDANGDAVVLYARDVTEGGLLERTDSTGAVTFSKNVPGVPPGYRPGLVLDAAGNAYVTESSRHLYPVRNSLATCGSDPLGSNLLSVFAPDGSILQTTYFPGIANPVPSIATGPNSTVFVVAFADASFAPTATGPFPAGTVGTSFLWRLSPNAKAPTFPLACLGNPATYDTGPIAPGELVTLFGSGLGPEQGIQTQATLLSPFPTQAANVAVTFDGRPAPLLWVQDAQINVVVPWSLTPGEITQVCVSYTAVRTNCLTWPVAQAAPTVFMVDGVYAAALNQDGTVNSAQKPAPQGSIVTVFATGLGPITPSQADGTMVGPPLPVNVLQVSVAAVSSEGKGVHINTQFDVTYAGPAPFLVAGASQINFKVVNFTGQIVVFPQSSDLSPAFLVYVAGQ